MKPFYVVFLVLFSPFVFSQTLTLDATFGTGGKVLTSFGDFDTGILSYVKQIDGKIVVRGYRSSFALNIWDTIIGRYNTDGTVDNSFGINGLVIISDLFIDGVAPNSLAIQSDGKIVVTGSKSINETDFYTYRYNIDGALDTGFGLEGVAIADIDNSYDAASVVLIQNDGKIIVTGLHKDFGIGSFAAVRYNSNGTLDADFGVNGKSILPTFVPEYESEVVSAIVEPDGKIIFGIKNFVYNVDNNFGLLRLNSNGTIDTSFGNNGVTITDLGEYDILSTILKVQDSYYALGYSSSENGSKIAIAKYNLQGILDTTFGSNGLQIFNRNNSAVYDFITDAKIVGDKILCSGYGESKNIDGQTNPDGCIYQFDLNGTIDLNFNETGYVITEFSDNSADFFTTLDVKQDGKIIAFGTVNISNQENFAMAKYQLTNLSLKDFSDSSFKLYPNPFSESITIESKTTNLLYSTIELYDVSGRIISVYTPNVINNYTFTLSNCLAKGNYFLKILNERKVETIKIVKQ